MWPLVRLVTDKTPRLRDYAAHAGLFYGAFVGVSLLAHYERVRASGGGGVP